MGAASPTRWPFSRPVGLRGVVWGGGRGRFEKARFPPRDGTPVGFGGPAVGSGRRVGDGLAPPPCPPALSLACSRDAGPISSAAVSAIDEASSKAHPSCVRGVAQAQGRLPACAEPRERGPAVELGQSRAAVTGAGPRLATSPGHAGGRRRCHARAASPLPTAGGRGRAWRQVGEALHTGAGPPVANGRSRSALATTGSRP